MFVFDLIISDRSKIVEIKNELALLVEVTSTLMSLWDEQNLVGWQRHKSKDR
jgi:hypothetical protein